MKTILREVGFFDLSFHLIPVSYGGCYFEEVFSRAQAGLSIFLKQEIDRLPDQLGYGNPLLVGLSFELSKLAGL
jgi:hypothetical protein